MKRSLTAAWAIVFVIVAALTTAWHWRRYTRQEEAYRATLESREVRHGEGQPPVFVRERGLKWAKVLSGDSILLAGGNVLHLAGIEAPEDDSPQADLSKSSLERVMSRCDVLACGLRKQVPGNSNVFEAEVVILPPRRNRGGILWQLRTIPLWQDVGFDCVNLGTCWLREDGPQHLLGRQVHAMAQGFGIWADLETLRAHVDGQALVQQVLNSRNPFGFFGQDVGVILSRLNGPQAPALLRQLFDFSEHRNLRYLVQLVRVGDRQPLDEIMDSLIAPSPVYPVRQRGIRLNSLSEILPMRLPPNWTESDAIYGPVYRWYQFVRNALRADDQAYRLILPESGEWEVPVQQEPGEPVVQLASGKSVPVQEKWRAFRPASITDLDSSYPVLWNGALYQVNMKGTVYEINMQTGANRRVYTGPGDPSGGTGHAWTLTFSDDAMLLGSPGGRLIGVNTKTWQQIWQIQEPQDNLRGVMGMPGYLLGVGAIGSLFVVQMRDGEIAAINLLDGKPGWTYRFGPRQQPPLGETPYTIPALINGLVVVCGRDRLLWLDPASGRLMRESAFQFTRVSSQPVLWEDSLFSTDDGRKVVALSWDSGSLLWQVPLEHANWPANQSLQCLPEGLLVTQRNGIRLLSYDDGHTIWRDTFEESVNRPAAAASDKFIFCLVSGEDRDQSGSWHDKGCTLVVYRRSDRGRVGEWRLGRDGSTVFRPPLVDGDEAYVGQFTPVIHCIKVYAEQ